MSVRRSLLAGALLAATLACYVNAAAASDDGRASAGVLTAGHIEEQLQVQFTPLEYFPLCSVRMLRLPLGMPHRPGPQCPESRLEPLHKQPDVTHLCCTLPRKPSCKCSACDFVHFRSAKFPAGTMPTQHRPVVAQRYGRVCCGRIDGRYLVPSPA